MNRLPLAVIAVVLVAGAGSSHAASLPPPPKLFAAVPAGTLQTDWGELPTYRTEGKNSEIPFVLTYASKYNRYSMSIPEELRAGDTAVVDVLVNRDGSIRDVKLLVSSGVEKVDRYLINRFVGAQALLQIAATDPAPYVIRQTVRATFDLRSGSDPFAHNQIGPLDTRPMGAGQVIAGDDPRRP